MDNFTFYSPTFFDFGKDAELHVADLIRRFGGSKVLLHYGGGSVKKNGLYDRVVTCLKNAGIEFAELGGVKPNPRSGLVYEGIEICKKEKVNFVLAMGGGSTIDSAKAIAAGSVYDGDFLDFYQGKAEIKAALPIGTILTIAAAGSEGSANTVITDESTLIKKGARSDLLRPKFSIMNPELTCTLPAYQTAAGATDIIMMGVTGTRLDHVLSNIHLLKAARDRGLNCQLLDPHNRICLADGHKVFVKTEESYPFVSFIPLTMEVKGITLTGFKYSLKDHDLILGQECGLCVSNRLAAEEAVLDFASGLLLVIESKD